jgi:hypothetical protein
MKLRVRTVDEQRNYDQTTMHPDGDLFDGDEDQLTELLEKMYDLGDLVSPDKFKSYEKLSEEYYRIIGDALAAPGSPLWDKYRAKTSAEIGSETRSYGGGASDEPAAQRQSPVPTKNEPADSTPDIGDDEDLAMFRDLVS